ncbi:MAG TPA: type II secretion system protein GspG [Kofleriaceae bacterium]|jgi:hypothetical protein
MKTLLLVVLIAACSPTDSDGGSKVDDATLRVRKYAFEAFPQWAMVHANKQCPDTVAALNEYVKATGTNDPWGHPYRMFCGANVPDGAKTLAIASDGPDGKPNTPDDIDSWK